MEVWEGKQVAGFLLTWRLLWHQLQQQTKDKYIVSSCYKNSLVNSDVVTAELAIIVSNAAMTKCRQNVNDVNVHFVLIFFCFLLLNCHNQDKLCFIFPYLFCANLKNVEKMWRVSCTPVKISSMHMYMLKANKEMISLIVFCISVHAHFVNNLNCYWSYVKVFPSKGSIALWNRTD